MPIDAICPSCGKKYQAPDRLAGKGMRCRNCGGLILLPLPPGAAAAAQQTSAATPRTASAAPAQRPTASAPAPAGPTRLHPLDMGGPRPIGDDDDAPGFGQSFPPPFEGADPNAAFPTGEESFEPPAPARREWVDLPHQKLLDTWLPRVAVGLSLLFAGSWMSSVGEKIPGMIWVSRFALALGTFALLVAPVTLLALGLAMRRAHVPWPRGGTWLCFASFIPAWALAVGIWNAGGGSTPALICGLFLGLALSAGATWLWFRLQPEEIPVVTGSASAGFVGGWLLSMGALWFLNLMAEGSMGKMNPPPTHSPVGQAFAWNPVPPPAAVAVLPKNPAPKIEGIGATPTDMAPKTGPDGPPLSGTTPAVAGVPNDIGGVAPETGTPSKTLTQAAGNPAAPNRPGPLMNANDPDGTGAGVPGAAASDEKPFVKNRTVSPLGAGVEAISPGLVPGPAIGVIRKQDGKQVNVEAWVDGKKTGSFGVDRGESPIVVHPDASKWARMSFFPRPVRLEIAPFDEYVKQRANVDALGNQTAPEALGFISPSKLLLRWKRGLAILDFSEGLPGQLKPYNIAALTAVKGTTVIAVNPAGTMAAIAFEDRGTPALAIIDLKTGTETKRLKVEVPKTIATGLAFSPDGGRVAVYQEGANSGALLTFDVNSGARKATWNYSTPPARKNPSWVGPSLAWLGSGPVLSLYGGALLHAETGAVLGQLDLDDAWCQHPVGDNGLEVVLRRASEESADPAIVRLTLDLPALNK